MQVTKVSLYSISCLLKESVKGKKLAGYTVRPGYSNGLFLAERVTPLSGIKGYKNEN